MKSLEEANRYFDGDQYAVVTTGIKIEAVDDDYAKCSLKIEKKHFNAANHVMGGAIFTLADFVFAVATNTPQQHVVTATSQITYLSIPKGDTLFAESQLIKSGKTLLTMQINISDNLGTKIAVVMMSGMKI